ncbi:MAG: hypothetical protein QW451_00755 [Candidatus Aenigmatarchaeota archaeon]
MQKEVGAILIFLGLALTFNSFRCKGYNEFLIQLMLGPTFLGLGLQLIK